MIEAKGIDGIFILSTCNRTEITGFAKPSIQLIMSLLLIIEGIEDFTVISNVYKNNDAINHLFNIKQLSLRSSQILGDYEIVGQLRQIYKLAQKLGTTNAYLERNEFSVTS